MTGRVASGRAVYVPGLGACRGGVFGTGLAGGVVSGSVPFGKGGVFGTGLLVTQPFPDNLISVFAVAVLWVPVVGPVSWGLGVAAGLLLSLL